MASESATKKWLAEDEIGSVELLEVFGSDLTVVNAARVSFNKEVDTMTERDGKLIAYLAKHNHISPFFHPQIRLRVKMPIFVAREWYRHQIGLARNEVSRRYVDSVPELWFPSEAGLRARDPKLKQGSKEEPIQEAEPVLDAICKHGRETVEFYNQLLEKGVAPEIARSVLPQSMYTEFIETGSLAAYARIYALRTDPGAQREIQAYARAIGTLLESAFPISWKALAETADASH
jgi:thymidylate synthase (FAD)